jgi:hypothetical protein
MRVVEDDEADKLKATGVWFDCPKKAKNYKDMVQLEVENEVGLKNLPKKQRGKK